MKFPILGTLIWLAALVIPAMIWVAETIHRLRAEIESLKAERERDNARREALVEAETSLQGIVVGLRAGGLSSGDAEICRNAIIRLREGK